MPTSNSGSININLEQLRRNEERLRLLNEQFHTTWTSTFNENDSISIGSYQMGISEPQEMDRPELRELHVGGEEIIRKEIKLTEIPRKKVKECGVAVFCKKNFK